MKQFPFRTINLLLFLFTIINVQLNAQCPGEVISFTNGSFEGVPSKGIAPPGWIACQSGQSPDIQPGNFGVTLQASDGNTYAGFYFIDTIKHPTLGSWQEGLSQQLTTPLKAGSVYHSSIDLANSSTTDCGLEPGCASLEIWGGYHDCDHSQLLWSSGNISNYDYWQNYLISFTPTFAYTFISIQIKGLGCSGMPYILADHLQPLVEEYHINAEINVDKDSVCTGTEVTLTATAANGAGAYTYTWSNGVTGSSIVTVNPGMNSIYTVTAIDSNGCVSEPASIMVHTLLPLKLKYEINPFCEGDSAWLILHANGGNGNYHMMFNQGNIYNDSIRFAPIRNTVYTITITDSCSSKTDTLELPFLPTPQADFTWSKTGVAEYSFKDISVIGAGKIVQWNWSFGDNDSTHNQNPVHQFIAGRNYNINLQSISDEGCKSKLVQKNLSVSPEVFPVIKNNHSGNPTGIDTGSPNDRFDSDYTLYIFTTTGNLLRQLNSVSGNPVVVLQTLSLPSGTYIYKTSDRENKIMSGKIVIIE